MRTIPLPESPLQHPTIVELSARFLSVRAKFAAGALRCILELGRILSAGRQIVRGQFGGWLRDLEIGYTTAERYLAVYKVHIEDPESVEACLPLGTRALHRLSRLTPEGRRVVQAQASTVTCGEEFLRITAPYVRIVRKVPARSRVTRLCKNVEDCRRQIEALRTMELPDPRECALLERHLLAIAAEAHRAIRTLARAV